MMAGHALQPPSGVCRREAAQGKVVTGTMAFPHDEVFRERFAPLLIAYPNWLYATFLRFYDVIGPLFGDLHPIAPGKVV